MSFEGRSTRLYAVPACTLARGGVRRRRARVRAWHSLGLLLVLLLAVSVGSDAGAGGAALGPAAGRLDRSFGTAGKVISDLGQAEVATGAVVQRDAQIVVAVIFGISDRAVRRRCSRPAT